MQLINSFNNRPATLRNRENGRRIFILANGPSVLNENLALLKGEVVIGMNASTMLEERFDFTSAYYVFSDQRFINAPEKRLWATEKLSPSTHRVVRADLRRFDDRAFEDRTTYVTPLSCNGFSHDLALGYYFGCTTTMLALQLAWHLGSREVYLLGCDLRYPKESPRFYAELKPQLEDAYTSVQLLNIVNAAKVFEKNGGNLVNCSASSFLKPYLAFQEFHLVNKSFNV